MQFKKPTSLSETFGGYFDPSNDQWVHNFLNSDEHYAVSNEDITIKRFRVILKDGSFYSIPYSILPILIYMGNKLIIKSYGIHITLTGKGLSIIENHINTETLLYFRESSTGIDTDNSDVFISAIKIQGKNISKDISEEEI